MYLFMEQKSKAFYYFVEGKDMFFVTGSAREVSRKSRNAVLLMLISSLFSENIGAAPDVLIYSCGDKLRVLSRKPIACDKTQYIEEFRKGIKNLDDMRDSI